MQHKAEVLYGRDSLAAKIAIYLHDIWSTLLEKQHIQQTMGLAEKLFALSKISGALNPFDRGRLWEA